MILLLDGYNVMKVGRIAPGRDFRERRKELIRLTVEYRRIKKGIQAFIFFDSKEEVFPNEPANPFVTVIFTRNESADDAIVRWIRERHTPPEIQVATDDSELRVRVKAEGAVVVSVSELIKRFGSSKTHFTQHAASHGKALIRPYAEEKPPIDPKTREEINRSLPWR